ncbi:hypothetical protein L6255_04020 [Candidatus Parcubacteria bacterium]|nr:hypothetical protein [Patescibacteria group bacterium]MBU4380660.1 hypothetical protein [Patescibacteria group bacterium]MCG2689577.1 hypothetical protein [Candidatus Parcubacteria bacterium]
MTTNYGNLNPVGYFGSAIKTGQFVSVIITVITVVAGLYFLVNLAMGGLSYATSAGDEKELAKARKTLSNALLGFLLVVSSYFISGYVALRLGMQDILKPAINTASNTSLVCVNITMTPANPSTTVASYDIYLHSAGVDFYKSHWTKTVGEDVISLSFSKSAFPVVAVTALVVPIIPGAGAQPPKIGMLGAYDANGCYFTEFDNL